MRRRVAALDDRDDDLRSADRVAGWLGGSARRSLSRLMAFLLLCIGVQILLGGVEDVALSLKGVG